MTKKMKMKSDSIMKGVTISGTLISHVRKIHELALEDAISEKVVRIGINNYAHHALSAYILSVAAIESFLNESYLSFSARALYRDNPLQNLPIDWLEKVEIKMKVLLVSQYLFGKSLDRGRQPFQDFAQLVTIRNDLVHYKMPGNPPRYIRNLDQKGITLTNNKNQDNGDYLWPHKLSCTEGIRWAHNTACNIISKLASYDSFRKIPNYGVKNFTLITRASVHDWFREHGIDPNTNHP